MIDGVSIHYASRIEDVLAVALPLLNAKHEVTPFAAEHGASAAA